MNWTRDRAGWPNADASRIVEIDRMRWHVQQMGSGPPVLLLHGTGATTHSYAALMPLLAERYAVTAIDLPGHGFTGRITSGSPALPNVARAIAGLLDREGIVPQAVVGHSAGAAIAVHMSGEKLVDPKALVAINGAFYPFPGFAGHIFPAAAKLLFLNPFAPRLFAFGAGRRRRVVDLIASTGSTLDERGIDLYQRALTSSDHVEGTLAMMAHWNLNDMQRRLAALDLPLLQIVGGRDATIDPAAANRTADVLQHGEMRTFDGCGHLVHEEKPAEVAETIAEFLARHGIARHE